MAITLKTLEFLLIGVVMFYVLIYSQKQFSAIHNNLEQQKQLYITTLEKEKIQQRELLTALNLTKKTPCQCDCNCPAAPAPKPVNYNAINKRELIEQASRLYRFETPFPNQATIKRYSKTFDRVIPELLNLTPFDKELMMTFWKTNSLNKYVREKDEVYPWIGDQIKNSMYGPIDDAVLWTMIRHFKPKKVLEIGSGFSTATANAALQRNYEMDKISFQHICIEPYRAKAINTNTTKNITIIQQCLQEVDLVRFKQLQENDVLFIDSSHVVAPYGDVVLEYAYILPSLQKGVVVHIHDIFLPNGYPEIWMQTQGRLYTEQYLLGLFLHNNPDWEILFPTNFLHTEVPLFKPYPHVDWIFPVSFWMRRIR